jgi:hypothetical protein
VTSVVNNFLQSTSDWIGETLKQSRAIGMKQWPRKKIAAFVTKEDVKVCLLKCISVATKTASVSEKKDQGKSDLKCF